MANISTPIAYGDEAPFTEAGPHELAEMAHAVFRSRFGRVRLLARTDHIPEKFWTESFSHLCLDHRYYPIVEEGLTQNFTYRYLLMEDREGRVRGIQPVFIVHQDLLAGVPESVRRVIDQVRRFVPSFLKLNTLMVGCSAGEGDLGGAASHDQRWIAEALHEVLPLVSKACNASIIVLKDFPSRYRTHLSVFSTNGYRRMPSLPAIRLELDFADFEDYMATRLSKKTRKNLRQKFKKTADLPIRMEVLNDASEIIDELYPLYLAVHERSQFRFEKLTRAYFCEIGRRMGDRARFFVWRLEGKVIAFSLCFVHAGVIHDCCLGLDYGVALDYHLYFTSWRDIVVWSLRQGLKHYYSGPLNYEPKLHFRCELAPLDLYVTHTNRWFNPLFRRILSFLEPVRHQPIIRRFRNAHEL